MVSLLSAIYERKNSSLFRLQNGRIFCLKTKVLAWGPLSGLSSEQHVFFSSSELKHNCGAPYLSLLSRFYFKQSYNGLCTGLQVNFLAHLQSFASKIFFPLANMWDDSQIISLRFGDMDDSNSQTFAGGCFSHSPIIKITRILRVCERWFRALMY